MSVFKGYDEMDASHRAAYDLGKSSVLPLLEQAERERDEANRQIREKWAPWRLRATEAEAQLAKVPTLVEALRKSCDELDATVAACDEDFEPYPDTMVEVSALLRGALTAYEQAQGEKS